ncbi:hypothetical protein J3E68DRAFT_412750 [Trichoderma sp. SZMC 28012]
MQFCASQDRPTASLWLHPHTAAGERNFPKRNPSSSRGRRRSTLMGKGPRCELCCVSVVSLVVGTAEAVGEAV